MRRALFVTVAVVSAAACSGAGREPGTTTTTAATITGHELPRNLRTSSERIATEVCKHEEHCGRGSVSDCMDATRDRVQGELRRWNCEPAAIRARFEECLVSFDSLGCDVVLKDDKRPLCPENTACDDIGVHMIAPGPQLERVWR